MKLAILNTSILTSTGMYELQDITLKELSRMNYESIKLVNENNKKVQQMKEQNKLKNKIKKLFKKN